MSAADSVVIRNIYYMMAYAFRALDVKEYARLGAESFESFADLMAAVLTIGMATQRRRGFEREYEEQREALHAVKGRIDVRGTMRLRAQLRSEVACTYDELTADTYKIVSSEHVRSFWWRAMTCSCGAGAIFDAVLRAWRASRSLTRTESSGAGFATTATTVATGSS